MTTTNDQLRRIAHRRLPEFVAPTDVKAWKREATRLRKRALAEVYLKGWPAAVVKARPRVVWSDTLRPDPAFTIRKLRYEACPDYWVPALLYVPTKVDGQAPVMINTSGHGAGGKASEYKQIRCANLARRGVIALNPEFIGMSELQADLHHNNQAHLNLTGLAGVGLFYLAMRKGLDVVMAMKNVDATRVGCTGLSGGGWQTIVLAALDPRITLAVPVAGYTALKSRVDCDEDLGDLEQMPPDLATVLDYQDMTAMLAPRPTLQILNNKDDCCFRTDRTRPVIYDAVVPTFEAFNAADCFEWHGNESPGTHNYGEDNRQALYRFLNKYWQLGAPAIDIHRPHDILTETALEVGLPEKQHTMLTLALERDRMLERKRQTPRTPAARSALRKKLAKVLRLPKYEVSASARVQRDDKRATMELDLGDWSIPVTAWVPSQTDLKDVEIFMDDNGPGTYRAGAGVASFTLEPLGVGASKASCGLMTLLDSIGERSLGIQVAQTLAAARWVAKQMQRETIHLQGHGYTASMVALLAAAMEPGLFHRLTITWEIMRLRHLMQWPMSYNAAPSLFCAGLLEVCDVPQMFALLEGVELNLPGRGVPAEKF